jgi:hypothetical protein
VLTVDLDEQCGGAAEQVRVVQNQEPLFFLKIFEVIPSPLLSTLPLYALY